MPISTRSLAAVVLLAVLSLTPALEATADTPAPYGADDLMNWAERTYPRYFPGRQSTQRLDPYLYRYYPASQNYLGVAGETIFVLGPISGGQLQAVGTLEGYRCQARPDLCYISDSSRLVAGMDAAAGRFGGGNWLIWGDQSEPSYLTAAVPGQGPRQLGVQAQQVLMTYWLGAILHQDGRVTAWGDGRALGRGFEIVPFSEALTMTWPGPVRQLGTAFSAKSLHLVALLADGSVWAYPGDRGMPRQIDTPGPIGALSQGAPEPIEDAPLHVIDTEGQVWRLALARALAPKLIANAKGMAAVHCNIAYYCVARGRDGSAWAWAMSGMSGTTRMLQTDVAVRIRGLSNVRQLFSDGVPGARALDDQGRLWTWLPSITSDDAAEMTLGAERYTDLACEFAYCLIRKADGSVWGWGFNGTKTVGKNSISYGPGNPLRVQGVALP